MHLLNARMNERAKVPPHPFPTGGLRDAVGSDTGSRTINPSKLLHPSTQSGRKQKGGERARLTSGWNAALFSQLGIAIRRWPWEPWELGGGEGRAPFTQCMEVKVMALAECGLGVGLGLEAKFLNDWLAKPGPWFPLGNLYSQEQCFIKTGKIIEEKCSCKGTGIYREQPCLDPKPQRINWGWRDTERGMQGSRAIPGKATHCPPRSGGSWEAVKGSLG